MFKNITKNVAKPSDAIIIQNLRHPAWHSEGITHHTFITTDKSAFFLISALKSTVLRKKDFFQQNGLTGLSGLLRVIHFMDV